MHYGNFFMPFSVAKQREHFASAVADTSHSRARLKINFMIEISGLATGVSPKYFVLKITVLSSIKIRTTLRCSFAKGDDHYKLYNSQDLQSVKQPMRPDDQSRSPSTLTMSTTPGCWVTAIAK